MQHTGRLVTRISDSACSQALFRALIRSSILRLHLIGGDCALDRIQLHAHATIAVHAASVRSTAHRRFFRIPVQHGG
jgi:hypothetical protein